MCNLVSNINMDIDFVNKDDAKRISWLFTYETRSSLTG